MRENPSLRKLCPILAVVKASHTVLPIQARVDLNAVFASTTRRVPAEIQAVPFQVRHSAKPMKERVVTSVDLASTMRSVTGQIQAVSHLEVVGIHIVTLIQKRLVMCVVLASTLTSILPADI
jgi:hypothetical protein